MIIKGVLLGTIEEQRAGGDKHPIDPASCPLESVGQPVTLNFHVDQRVGTVTRLWLEEGRVLFEAEIVPVVPTGLPPIAAIGIQGRHTQGVEVVMADAIFGIGLTDANENRDQPPYSIVEPS